ncbi:MAG: mandelate racemase/muconate lactonizing enzyme family protein, partial [Chloroflexota bacterium]|nr:mandelate racemase/muconate lactonizing enzyme family protein [Chloroflexota bacterium]
DVKTFRMSAESHKSETNNWLFVKIYTDTGIYGVGEGSLQYKDLALIGELEDFSKFLIGKDPFGIEYIWTSLYRRVTWTGGAVTMSAISAIDLALWDLKGKALGVPVYELLGGKVRDAVPVYANGWFEDAITPSDHAEAAIKTVKSGYPCLKFYPFKGEYVTTPDRINTGVELVKAVREAVGANIQIGIDIRARLDFWSAIQVVEELIPYKVSWIEEPIQFDNPKLMGDFARKSRIPISTGEQLYSRWDFQPLLDERAVSIIQPDICHAGGISELRKIASAAETQYVSVAPHNSNGPISTVSSLHLDMNIPNCFKQEIFVSFLDRYNSVLTNPIPIKDGFAIPPVGSGWGTDIDEYSLEKFPPSDYTPVDSEPYQDFF